MENSLEETVKRQVRKEVEDMRLLSASAVKAMIARALAEQARPEPLVPKAQAAKELGVSGKTLGRWEAMGRIERAPCSMGRVLYRRSDLEGLKGVKDPD